MIGLKPELESELDFTIGTVGVVGAGAMGRGIAQVCAVAGYKVYLFDMAEGAARRAVEGIQADLAQAHAKGRLSAEDMDSTLQRVVPIDALKQLAECDLVVEAIIEKLQAKQELMQRLESIVTTSCVLATNTSSLSVTAIAAACAQPQRIAGWHFFNPVTRMRVVEVIKAPRTSASVIQALTALSVSIGHRAVVTSDSPGFVVNHAGRAFVTEGLKLLSECTAEHAVLDGILRTCAGFRMGPFELLDLTGLDVSVPVMESIHAQYYGDDRYRPVPLASTRMQAGLLGRKTGQGFYTYAEKSDKRAEKSKDAVAAPVESRPALWWPNEGPGALPEVVQSMLPMEMRVTNSASADLLLLAPLDTDLSSCVASLQLDAGRAIAIDPLFSSAAGVTLMVCPGTQKNAIDKVHAMFAARSSEVFIISDSPGYVAPRVVACIVNLACEMAQQGVASPQDIDAAVRLGLGYPMGPFEWGDRLGSATVLRILEGLHSSFGDQRYRPSPWLVRRARLHLPLASPDRAI